MVLAAPPSDWTALDPHGTWNRKLFTAFGRGCWTQHKKIPPDEDGLFTATVGNGHIQPKLLSKDSIPEATGFNTLNHNCNEPALAEAMTMLKEHLLENDGEFSRTASARLLAENGTHTNRIFRSPLPRNAALAIEE